MRFFIVHFPRIEFVEIQHDDGRVVLSRPFFDDRIVFLEKTAHGDLLAVASRGAVALIDPADGSVKAKDDPGHEHVSGSDVHLIRQGERLLVNRRFLSLYDCADLTALFRNVGVLYGVEESPLIGEGLPEPSEPTDKLIRIGGLSNLRERRDPGQGDAGALVFSPNNNWPVCMVMDLDRATATTHRITGWPEEGTLDEHHPLLDHGFISLDPGGELALRHGYQSLPSLPVPKKPGWMSWGRKAAPDHRDMEGAVSPGYGVVLELWDLRKREKIKDLIVRYWHDPEPFDPDDPWEDASSFSDTGSKGQLLAMLADPDGDLLAQLREPDFVEDEDSLLFAMDLRTALRLVTDLVERIFWEDDGRAFWIEFKEGGLRRVTLEGDISPIFLPSQSEDGTEPFHGVDALRQDDETGFVFEYRHFVPAGYTSVFIDRRLLDKPDGKVVMGPADCRLERHMARTDEETAFATFETGVELTLDSLDMDDCLAALKQLTEWFTEDLERFVNRRAGTDDFLDIHFIVGGERLPEKEFFDHVGNDQKAMEAPLVALLESYLDKAEQRRNERGNKRYLASPSTGYPALYPAIEALLRMGSERYELFQRFLNETDFYKSKIGEEIVETLAAVGGWKDAPAVRFGLFLVEWGYRRENEALFVSLWSRNGLSKAAREYFTPIDLVREMVAFHHRRYPPRTVGKRSNLSLLGALFTVIGNLAFDHEDDFDKAVFQAMIGEATSLGMTYDEEDDRDFSYNEPHSA